MSNKRNKKQLRTVTIIGAGGRVGFSMSLVLANSGYFVYGVEIDETKNQIIMKGKIPFKEKFASVYLKRTLKNGTLEMTSDYSVVKKSDVVVIVIGTPIDENFNPVLTPLRNLIVGISPYLKKNQLIILRSTVSPGTTDIVKELIESNTPFRVGKDIYLVFAPERVIEGRAIEEIQKLPQLIGAYDNLTYSLAERFFKRFIHNKCLYLRPIEAEIGKLITNMARYMEFAMSNEFFLIAETFKINIHKVIDAISYDYPRLHIPSPGPNVGGPCLHKDGWFLIERIPYPELISTAFKINEGMTMQIVNKIHQYKYIKKITILGMTFKANSDDPRSSLSFKLEKQLGALNYQLITVEPNLKGYEDIEKIRGSDAVILMTPHRQFRNFKKIIKLVNNPNCLFVDIWGFWKEMKYHSDNGYFLAKEVDI